MVDDAGGRHGAQTTAGIPGGRRGGRSKYTVEIQILTLPRDDRGEKSGLNLTGSREPLICSQIPY